VTGHTVVGDRVVLNVGFRAARTRLKKLAESGMLLRASEVAYGEGITAVVELAGPAAGLTRLADICTEDLTQADDCAHTALQWDAIGADGELFTGLLADLMLVPAGDQISALSLTEELLPRRTVPAPERGDMRSTENVIQKGAGGEIGRSRRVNLRTDSYGWLPWSGTGL
jgi:hypothetical protein